ncbi:hypothetical protein [Nocardioides sp.]|uniref:hypothetical protein n=1 Tax=Nocardioides sp. TaxID=35761 RepID=UPI002ED295FC
MGDLTVERMPDSDRAVRRQVADVFVDGYFDALSKISKDRERWSRALEPSFVPEVFYVARDGDEIVGIAACSTNQTRARRLSRHAMAEHLGRVRGTFAYEKLAYHEFARKKAKLPKVVGYEYAIYMKRT